MNSRILFIGGTIRGLKLMELLINQGEKVVFAYIMKEDNHESIKVSRDLKKLCKEHNIPTTVCKRIAPDEIPQILELSPNVAFVCGWRTLISPLLYKNIPLGCLAAHDSLLPKYRGFAPLNWAIINGEKHTGVTLFKIRDGAADSGEIFGQKVIDVGKEETAADVYPRIVNATIELYTEFLSALKTGTLKWQEQDESQATYTCKRIPDDGEIDWNKAAREVFNLIRALSPPYPCAWIRYNSEKVYITKAFLPQRQLRYSGNIPGRVVSILDNGVLVLCGTGQIIINEIRNSAGKNMNANKLFSSIKITLGR